MGYRRVALLLGLVLSGACGKEIGDACAIASDCSPNGDRICIDPLLGGDSNKEVDASNPWKGYCTIRGCDYSTCPGEATCVRFFSGNFSNKLCDPTKAPDACVEDPADCCSLDELCAVDGHCVPRSSEIRYCMRTCDSDGDCRDGYECRDLEKMKAHGGEPVLEPGVQVDAHAPKFCAAAPASP